MASRKAKPWRMGHLLSTWQGEGGASERSECADGAPLLEVEGIEEAVATLKSLGVPLLDEKPRTGARGHKIAFLHPKATGGLLVELVEPDDAHH